MVSTEHSLAVSDSEDERLERVRQAAAPGARAMQLHPFYRGKVQVLPKCPIRDLSDLAIWYTPGVAEPCRDIASNPGAVWQHTNRANTVAIVSDGTRVLGLGDIGPEAGLPVMEGKALLFKYLGGVDAVPLCLGTTDAGELVRTVEILQPSFGAINLEDIAQPKCFRVLEGLRERLAIPVWHDDQQGTAVVLLAGLLNALEVVGKSLHSVRIVQIGFGAANVATHRLLRAVGIDPGAIVVCDSKGSLHPGRQDIEKQATTYPEKWRACTESNAEHVVGSIEEALRGADVCIAFSRSGPGVIEPAWVRTMAADSIVFACANPAPEIWPWDALDAGARIVATGRGDFPNQLNNSLGFPAIFRGVLDVRARAITDGMAIAAAREIAAFAKERGLRPDSILPRMDEWESYPRVATATAMRAIEEGVAAVKEPRGVIFERARGTILKARSDVAAMTRDGVIPLPPDVWPAHARGGNHP